MLAVPQMACIPPERCMKIPNPSSSSSAVIMQYSAKSCPNSSFWNTLAIDRSISKPVYSIKFILGKRSTSMLSLVSRSFYAEVSERSRR